MIEVSELTKRYGGTTAVKALSFTVRPGQVTGFLGPNGAGKSTTLRMILGLHRPTSGTVTVNGRPFRDRPRGLRHVGSLLDAHDVHGGRTAAAHLSALARSNGIPKSRVREVLEEVGLADAARRRIGGFSLGMKQRLGIASALLGDPPVLLFDEPLNGLDPEGVKWVRELFRRLAAEGRTVFVSSHLMSEMEHTADELVVIGRGELIASESLAEFSSRGARHSVTVGTPADTVLRDLLIVEGATVQAADATVAMVHAPATSVHAAATSAGGAATSAGGADARVQGPTGTVNGAGASAGGADATVHGAGMSVGGEAGTGNRAAGTGNRAAGTLNAAGAKAQAAGELLTVTGLTAARIGEIALEHRIPLYELSTRSASLEEAFMELTADSVQYLAGEAR